MRATDFKRLKERQTDLTRITLTEKDGLETIIHLDEDLHYFFVFTKANDIRHGKNVFLDLWSEAQHSDDLGHPCSGDHFPASNFGLIGDLVGLNESLQESVEWPSF